MTIEIIDEANHLDGIPHEIEMALALPALFEQFNLFGQLNLKAIRVEDRYGNGLSGSYIFKVRPVSIGRAGKMLPSVVKIGPFKLIEQEWKTYHNIVKGTLPEIPSLEGFALSDGKWGGLRYGLAGNDVENVVSLYNYARSEVDIDDLCKNLDRLFKVINTYWWGECEVVSGYKMWADYDRRLPVNLLLKYLPPFPGKTSCIDSHLPLPNLELGNLVQIKDFVIEEIDQKEKVLTLNLPDTSGDSPLTSYRVRVKGVPNISEYQKYQQENKPIPAIYGKIIDTRHAHLTTIVAKTLPEAKGLSAEQFILPNSGLTLPNPLFYYQKILVNPPVEIYVSTIHGDLNTENILIYPMTGRFTIIDFATARRSHAIHDLLRLETEVVTKLISEILIKANLSTENRLFRTLCEEINERVPDTRPVYAIGQA